MTVVRLAGRVAGAPRAPGLSAADEAGGGLQDAVARGPRLRSGEVATRSRSVDGHWEIRLGNLAAIYSDLGRLGDALPLQERALAITEAALGPDHPNTRLGEIPGLLRD